MRDRDNKIAGLALPCPDVKNEMWVCPLLSLVLYCFFLAILSQNLHCSLTEEIKDTHIGCISG